MSQENKEKQTKIENKVSSTFNLNSLEVGKIQNNSQNKFSNKKNSNIPIAKDKKESSGSQLDFSKISVPIVDNKKSQNLDINNGENTNKVIEEKPNLNKKSSDKIIMTEETTKQEKEIKKSTKIRDASSNIMMSANIEEKGKLNKKEIVLNELHISPSKPIAKKKFVFGDSGVHLAMNNKKFHINYWKVFMLSFVSIVLSVLAIIIAYGYSQYIQYATQAIIRPPYDTYVQKIDSYEQALAKYIPWNDYNLLKNTSLLNSRAKEKLYQVVKSDRINYVHKKLIIQSNLNKIFTEILKDYDVLTELKQDITKYGFLTQDLYNLTQTKKQVMSIQKSLLSLEVIKFSSAINVFSYLETFLDNFGAILNMKPDVVQEKINKIVRRGEKDIYVYLNNCYLNPYEVNYKCGVIDDFNTFYKINPSNEEFDTKFFADLMEYIDVKLEQTEIPSFSILFKKFDPSRKEITFTIDVNTFQKDEIALTQKGIINPHIFVITKLLNLLKQSMFIVGKTIDIKELKVEPKIIQIGNNKYSINHSKMEFTLPIQKSTQREIFDFVGIINNWYDAETVTSATTNESYQMQNGEVKIVTGSDGINIGESTPLTMTFSVGNDFSRSLAEVFLEAQKDQTNVAFILQEKGQETLITDWINVISNLQNKNYSNEQISEVIDYIIFEEKRKNKITTLSKLLEENEDGINYFDQILKDKYGDTNSEAISKKTKLINENITQEEKSNTIDTKDDDDGGFFGVRQFFESGQD